MIPVQDNDKLPTDTDAVQDVEPIIKRNSQVQSGSTIARWGIKTRGRFFVAWRSGVDPANRPQWQVTPFMEHVGGEYPSTSPSHTPSPTSRSHFGRYRWFPFKVRLSAHFDYERTKFK